ncbi:mediator of RNA polymerase II transcription subunit 20a-like isoform X1 [Diospyros lotus]|uniref:mediator of RNA polymerase II transcription subunit 20a-like isoform X1 n=1 Tax=Diospyros lotus TaxID=55363 RepID=UPI00224EB220|nr:mediator of RNA polymerase II transcription subunit 20a-like isoform X1 [Diospyros lotus]
MPNKWVLNWQPNAGTTVNSQILNEVSQCVEGMNGVKEGRWKAALTFYKPMLREQALAAEFPRDFMGISLPEQPSKYYFVIRGQKIVLEAEQTIQTIMEKLQSYKTRVTLNFEDQISGKMIGSVEACSGLYILQGTDSRKTEGSQYRLGDFQLRVGKVVPLHSESLRGIVMEMEYLPISSLDKSRQMMEEFFDVCQEALSKRHLPGHFMHIEPNFAEYGLFDNYTSQHTAIQYATIMAQLIATAHAVQPVRN